MAETAATRRSGFDLPMPEQKALLSVYRVYTSREFDKIKKGYLPEYMEQKWFMFFEDDWLHIHRSWTGKCIFQLRFSRDNRRYRIAEAWVNRHPKQYPHSADRDDAAVVVSLIDKLLLGKKSLSEKWFHFRMTLLCLVITARGKIRKRFWRNPAK